MTFLDKTKEQKHPPWRYLARKWTKFISVENINETKTSVVEIVTRQVYSDKCTEIKKCLFMYSWLAVSVYYETDVIRTITEIYEKDWPLQTKMKFSFRYLFSKYDKVHIFFCIWINLLKKYWIENFIFCVVGFFVTNVLYNHLVSEVHLQVPKTVKSCRKAILSRWSISS